MTAHLGPLASAARPDQRRATSAAANWQPATTPTITGPKPRPSRTCSGRTGRAAPITRKPTSTAVIIGASAATTVDRSLDRLKPDLLRHARRGNPSGLLPQRRLVPAGAL